jgi:hypothetical protein
MYVSSSCHVIIRGVQLCHAEAHGTVRHLATFTKVVVCVAARSCTFRKHGLGLRRGDNQNLWSFQPATLQALEAAHENAIQHTG